MDELIKDETLDCMCGISDDELTHRFCEAVRIENEIKEIKGLPIAGFNRNTHRAYIKYPNGRVEYVAET